MIASVLHLNAFIGGACEVPLKSYFHCKEKSGTSSRMLQQTELFDWIKDLLPAHWRHFMNTGEVIACLVVEGAERTFTYCVTIIIKVFVLYSRYMSNNLSSLIPHVNSICVKSC